MTVVSVMSLASVSERSYHRKPNNSQVFSKEYNSFRLRRSSAIESYLFCVVVLLLLLFFVSFLFYSGRLLLQCYSTSRISGVGGLGGGGCEGRGGRGYD